MLMSGGVLVKGTQVLWAGSSATWGNWPLDVEERLRWSGYSQLYREQLWVAVLVNKLARAQSRLPLKVYRRGVQGRVEASDHPYAKLLARPHPWLDERELRKWVASTRHLYGEALLLKERDRGGRPVRLWPLHPSNVSKVEEKSGRLVYEVTLGGRLVEGIDQADVVHYREYHPESTARGLSRLEPLRRSLEAEDAARRATSAFWRHGARPSVLLRHPKALSDQAHTRLRHDWEELHSGPDSWGRAAILEEGMEATVVPLNHEEAQYVEARRLHREEVCAIFDVPPPVVHILDRATFSNITEQMRSMYRDTMAPILQEDEAVLEYQLRGSVRKGATEPDFGEGVYAEHLLDEVLRGDFESRVDAYQKGINSGWLMPAEVRQMENRPFVEGSDRLYINSTMIPLSEVDSVPGRDAVEDEEEALPPDVVRSLMGRLGRLRSLDEVDPDLLVRGLNGWGDTVRRCVTDARQAGDDLAGLRARLTEGAA